MARVQITAFARSTRPEDVPEAIRCKQAELGAGWSVYVEAVTPPPQRHTAERKGRRRLSNLARRVQKTVGPMFAQDVIDQQVARKPDYYAGAEVSQESAAYVAHCDAEDARRWAAYLAWLAAGAEDVPVARGEGT